MKTTLYFIGNLVLVILLIDFIALLLWIASGQTPQTGIYAGTITAHFINLIIK